MTKFSALPLAIALIASPLAAQTASSGDTAAIVAKPNDTVLSADGRRIGRIDTIRAGQAMVIYNGRFVSIPVASLTLDGKRLQTSLKLAEITRR